LWVADPISSPEERRSPREVQPWPKIRIRPNGRGAHPPEGGVSSSHVSVEPRSRRRLDRGCFPRAPTAPPTSTSSDSALTEDRISALEAKLAQLAAQFPAPSGNQELAPVINPCHVGFEPPGQPGVILVLAGRAALLDVVRRLRRMSYRGGE